MRLFKRPTSPHWMVDLRSYGGGRESTNERSKAAALIKAQVRVAELQDAAKLRQAIESGEVAEVAPLRELADAWLAHIKAKGNRDTKHPETRIRKLFGEAPFEDLWSLPAGLMSNGLRTQHLDRIIADRLGAGAAPATVNHELRVLRAVLRWSESRDYQISRVKFELLAEEESTRWLTESEEAAFLTELDPSLRTRKLTPQIIDQYDFALGLLRTGMRYSELAGLRWLRDVDTVNFEWIIVRRTKNGTVKRLQIADDYAAVLRRRYAETGTLTYVYTGYDKRTQRRVCKPRAHSTDGMKSAMVRAGINSDDNVAGLGKATIHTLRHTFASRMVQNGMSIEEVQELLGHKTIRMTQRYATMDFDSVSAKAANVFNKLAAL